MAQQPLGEALLALMKREGATQSSLAREADVSQSAVSRAVRGKPLRQGRARERLSVYMRQRGIEVGPSTQGALIVLEAFNQIWDGSEAHAAAMARLIAATEGLAPTARADEGHS